MRDFRKYEIWKLGIELVKQIYALNRKLPDSEKFGLKSQMGRCSVSIPSNIAEGCSRDSQKDFKRFLQISLGSLFELETQLIICRELNFITNDEFRSVEGLLRQIQKQIASLINKITNG